MKTAIYQRILRTEYAPGCFVLVSFKKRGDDNPIQAEPMVSFLYDAGNTAAEWCPPYGPISIWHRGTEGKQYNTNHIEGDEPEYKDAMPHYAYPFVIPSWGNWSQLSVERYQLAEYAIDGNYKYIFNVLKGWAESK